MNGTETITRPIDHNARFLLHMMFYLPIVVGLIYIMIRMDLGFDDVFVILVILIIYLFIPSYLYSRHRNREHDKINQAIYEEKHKYNLLYKEMVDLKVQYEANEMWIERIFENCYDGLMITDHKGKVMRCNQALLQLFEIPKERLSTNDYCNDIFTIENKLCDSCNNAYVLQTGIKQSRRIDFNGKIIDQLTIPVYDKHNKINAFIKTYRDVTQQKNMEYKVNRATKLEAIGSLTIGISHDFNNILQVILGYSDLIHYHLKKTEQYDLVTKVMNIREAAFKAEGLIQKLLNFSKQDRFHKEVLNINTSVEDIGHILERIIGEKISLIMDLDYQVEDIIADKTQMEQIIVNLCVNAKDAIGEEGDVKIKTYNVMKKSGQFVCLQVSDNGIGIDVHAQSKIFEPFFTTKDLGEGTGLGLATVLGIVEDHGGTIEFESEVGHGTSFKILFPSHASNVMMMDQHKEHHVPKTKEDLKVLLVQEDNILMGATKALLEKMDIQVLTAREGYGALKDFDQFGNTLDLVILDANLSDIEGIKVFEQIRSLNKKIKVLMTTSFNDATIMEAKSVFKQLRLIQKPYTNKELMKAIAQTVYE